MMLDPRSAMLARNWWAIALRGVLGILFGVAALLMPVAVVLTLAWAFAFYLLLDGVFAVVAAVWAAQHHERWGTLLAEGLLNVIVAALVWLFPFGAVLGFVLLVAAWALISGGLMLGSAFILHPTHGRFWLALGGVVSMLCGVVLAVAPLAGALVLTWWLGIYAILFGISLLVLSVRLRARRSEIAGAKLGA